jgi:hypothetical protein
VVLISWFLLISACHPVANPSPDTLQQRQEILDRIADDCGMPHSSWNLLDKDHLTLRPEPNTPYEKVDCLLRGLDKSKLPVSLGFVGNEAYPGNAP